LTTVQQKESAMKQAKYKGFTLVELLVVIAIIALLLSILMPALGKARQAAMRVVCSTHLNQIGVGIALYMADKSEGRYPQQIRPITSVGNWWQEVAPYIDDAFDGPSPGVAKATVGNCPNHTAKEVTTSTDDQYSYRANILIMTNWYANPFAFPPVQPEPVISAGKVRQPAEKILVFEVHTEMWIPDVGGYDFGGWLKYPFHIAFGLGPENQTHGNVSNFLFCDTHVASHHGDELRDRNRYWNP
jgi:prepilin-type N-terminal cleavage/methylation domain-containing protein/prepilin-type processing-associated H-X9-DG protein